MCCVDSFNYYNTMQKLKYKYTIDKSKEAVVQNL